MTIKLVVELAILVASIGAVTEILYNTSFSPCYNGCGRPQIVCSLRHLWEDKVCPVLIGFAVGTALGVVTWAIQNYLTPGGI